MIIHKNISMHTYPTDADIEVDTLREENQQLRGENQELKNQLALVQPPIMEIQTTSAQLSKLLLIHNTCMCMGTWISHFVYLYCQ